jgi:hypothetical protein
MKVLGVLALFLLPIAVTGQSCPQGDAGEAVQPSTLRGTIAYHNDLRGWIGLKLQEPACGQHELQLVFFDGDQFRLVKALSGCKVTATGKIYEGLTGYYSAHFAIQNPEIKPDSLCRSSAVEPDLYAQPIAPGVNAWRATITVDYRGKGQINVNVQTLDKSPRTLTPWQPYVHYMLTGGADVIWFSCRAGFRMSDIVVSPASEISSLDEADETKGASLRNMSGLNTATFRCSRR